MWLISFTFCTELFISRLLFELHFLWQKYVKQVQMPPASTSTISMFGNEGLFTFFINVERTSMSFFLYEYSHQIAYSKILPALVELFLWTGPTTCCIEECKVVIKPVLIINQYLIQ